MPLTKEQVNNIKPEQVRQILGEKMLLKGLNLVFDPIKSHGSYMHDKLTGKDYLDFFSFYASLPISHNHPKLHDPEFIKKISTIALHNPSNTDIYTVELAQFVATFERVCMPKEFKYLFFIAGGTLAVENALKVAIDWKVRKNFKKGYKLEKGQNIIHFKNAFHGRSGYSLSLTNTDPAKYLYFPQFKWPRFDLPIVQHPLYDPQNLKNVIETEAKIAEEIEQFLINESDDIAAIILEPIQAEGGDLHVRPEFLQKLRQFADKYEVLLIADEVQTGLGLTGKTWAYENFGIVPDIVAFGKKLQVCGIMCTSRIDDIEDNVFKTPSRMNSTWGGNLVDMVRSTRLLEIIEEDNLIDNAKQIGEYVLVKLKELSLKHKKITNVRGKGLMCAFDLPDQESVRKLKKLAFENNLLIIICGLRSIRIRPVLDVSIKEVDKLIEILDKILPMI